MEYLTIGLLIGIFAFIAWNYFNTQKQINSMQTAKKDEESFNKRIDDMNQNMTTNLNKVMENVLNQLNNFDKRVDSRLKVSTESMNSRMDNAAKVVNTVNSKLSKIEESNKRIYDVGKDISSLQELLKSPKLRGGLGEHFLGDLLAQIFPKEHYQLQYTFKSGAQVDAIINVQNGLIIPVDAKFPLENFKKMMEADEDDKLVEQSRKAFISDVKKRIDEIATKYILPDEGTLDFALMYVPAENIYYEMIINDPTKSGNISSYAFSKKVIPVSPNTFYIYLQTILIGLRGFQIEKKAGEILSSLSRLRGDFEKFGADFTLVGTHLGRAQNSFTNSEKRFTRFSDKLGQVESLSGRSTQSLSKGNEEPQQALIEETIEG